MFEKVEKFLTGLKISERAKLKLLEFIIKKLNEEYNRGMRDATRIWKKVN